jgi:hypothetical protein
MWWLRRAPLPLGQILEALLVDGYRPTDLAAAARIHGAGGAGAGAGAGAGDSLLTPPTTFQQ